MTDLPDRIKPDAIAEALFEVRFESNYVPEVVMGLLSQYYVGKRMALERLPIADIPFHMRKADPNLAFAPILQFKSEDGSRVAKLGDQVLSWHVVDKYPGWPAFFPELKEQVELLANRAPEAIPIRLGFRYINALTTEDHGVRGIQDLNLQVVAGGRALESAVNVNYKVTENDKTCLVKVATPEVVTGFPRKFAIFIDIDVTSEGRTSVPRGTSINDWIDDAHIQLKKTFFGLLSPQIVESLKEK